MNKIIKSENPNPITVDIEGLQSLLSLGRGTANKIGEQAGAVIKIGKRKIYNVERVKAYMDTLTEA